MNLFAKWGFKYLMEIFKNWDRVSCNPGWQLTHCIAKDEPESLIPLLPPPPVLAS